MNHLRVPTEISSAEMRVKDVSWSPGMYRKVIIPTRNARPLRELLDVNQPFNKGVEPGSASYMRQSTHYLIRTKALQDHSCLICAKGDAITPVNPLSFVDPKLLSGQILLSKDSNVGACAMVDGSDWKNYMFSSGIVRIHPVSNPYYIFAFLKNQIFKEQILAMAARGATITHAKTLWLDCLIPFPNRGDVGVVVEYVAAIMQAIIEKELAIRARFRQTLRDIHAEIMAGYETESFKYVFPSRADILVAGRMDAGFWSSFLRYPLHAIGSYRGGCWESIYAAGYRTRRGPNLAVSVVGPGYYFDKPNGSARPLATPGDITDYMTIPRLRYYGNSRHVGSVRRGEVMFAAKGVREVSIGHAYVHLSEEELITNFDSFLIDSGDVSRNIYLAQILSYFKAQGVFSRLADASNGGSLVESHFRQLPIPKFSDDKQAAIVRLYHNPSPPPRDMLTLKNFVEWHRRWNVDLGIWELERERKFFQRSLAEVEENIIAGKTVQLPF